MMTIKVGLEIHRQLETRKLFCNCPSEICEEKGSVVVRNLRASKSELGEVDAAAMEEEIRDKTIIYETANACLVEVDEEPPHPPNPEALKIALTCALLFGSTPVDEVHFMRKIVVDGSNTTGFQRTALIAIGGYVRLPDCEVPIQTICLEEDAARRISRNGKTVTYRLDRLGIPLIEIATAPTINSPEMAYSVAKRIGQILKATGRVRRGLGTIRQDLNVSIHGGSKVEIKGVQDLPSIPIVVRNEAERQAHLIELAHRVPAEDIPFDPVDLTELLQGGRGMRKRVKGSVRAYGLRLPGFKGLLGSGGSHRLGKELAQYAKSRGAGGIIHSDELPNYGIDDELSRKVRHRLECASDDAFVLIIASARTAIRALEAVVQRVNLAKKGVPSEVRRALPDGTTEYMRPIPGAARMYPETDVPPVRITEEMIISIRSSLPELPEERIERYVKDYGIHRQMAEQIADEEPERFENLVRSGVSPRIAARTLINTFSELRSHGIDVDSLCLDDLTDVLLRATRGEIGRQAVPEALRLITEGMSVESAITAMGVRLLSDEDLRKMALNLVREREDFVLKRGIESVGPLMGDMMKRAGGGADGRRVNAILKEVIIRFLDENS